MEKLLKFNHKLACTTITFVVGINMVKYGLTYRGIITLICCVIFGIIGTTAIYFSKLEIRKKIVTLNFMFGFAAMVYGVLSGGSTNAFYTYFLVLAISAIYFDSKLIKSTTVPLTIVAFIVMIVWPEAISGEGTSTSGSVTKVLFFVVTAIIIHKATSLGEESKKEAVDALTQVRSAIGERRHMANELNDTVVESKEAVSGIVHEVHNIDELSRDMSEAILEMTGGIGNVNNSIGMVDGYIKKNAKISGDLLQKYKEVEAKVSEGNEDVIKARNTIVIMEQAVRDAATVSDDLSNQMKEIGSILDEIDNIASETTLLSLNASIEAARAGEHGKGFAVVASEIRKLSEESTKSAGDIKKIIESLYERVSEVTAKIENGSIASRKGYEEMDRIKNILQEISDRTGGFEVVIEQENAMMKDISDEFESIADEMRNLYIFSENNNEKLYNIQNAIKEQDESVMKLEEKMNHVKQLADDVLV